MLIDERVREERVFDFVVAGGGLAGLCAAIAAARKGLKTAVIQDRPVFGGCSSSEIRVTPLGSTSDNAWARETGIIEELLLKDRAVNPDHFYDNGLTNGVYDLVLYEAAKAEKNLSIFLNTTVQKVMTGPASRENADGGKRIQAVIASHLLNGKELTFYAGQFADCTGDATVGALAGAEFMYGREARGLYNEPFAPTKADDITMGSSILFTARDIGKPNQYVMPSWGKLYRTQEELGVGRNAYKPTQSRYGGFWWTEIGIPYHQLDAIDEVRDELLKHAVGIWNYIKNYSPDKEAAANYALEWVGMIPGKRETRRLIGDVVITEHDCRRDAKWPDRVSMGGWKADIHINGGFLNKEEPANLAILDKNFYNYWLVAPYTIPLRALYSKDIENLWMAGRNISASRVAFGSTRVQQTLANIGQAVGTAAAYAIKNGLTPRQTANPEDRHITSVQQQLVRDDVHILGIANEDDQDMARNAKITASSEAALDLGLPDTESFQQMNCTRAQVFPVTEDHIDYIEFYIRNDNDREVVLETELQEMRTLWDQSHGSVVGTAAAAVSPKFTGWVRAEWNVRTNPNRAHRIMIKKIDGVSWAQCKSQPTGTTAQYLHVCKGGCDPRNVNKPSLNPDEILLPPFEKWNQNKWFSFATRISPIPRPYGAANINNGMAWCEDMPNLWVSDPERELPQSIEIDFGKDRTFTTVQVTFDTQLNVILSKMPEFWRAHTCASSWELSAKVKGGWSVIYKEEDNFLRQRVVKFDPVTSSVLKLKITGVNPPYDMEGKYPVLGRDRYHGLVEPYNVTARIFEIRVYNE